MLELIDELRAETFSVFIVTGGGTEFVRAISQEFYAVPPEASSGRWSTTSSPATRTGGRCSCARRLFGTANEGAAKVTTSSANSVAGRSSRRATRRVTARCSSMPWPPRAVDGPARDHDDAEREYAYEGRAGSFETDGSFDDTARGLGITVVSMRSDWVTVF